MAKLLDFLEKALFPENKKEVSLNEWVASDDTIYQLWAYRLALHIAAENLGTLLSKCEFKTFIKGEETKNANYYLLNVETNPNQSAAEFKKQMVRRMILNPDHDVLILNMNVIGSELNQGLYVASDFQRDPTQIYEAKFKNVNIDVFDDGGIPLKGVFGGDKAIYMKYTNSELNQIFMEMRKQYADMIENAMKAGVYRQKYVLTMDQTAMVGDDDFEENMRKLTNDSFKAFVTGNEAILPVYAGMKIDQTSAGADLGQNASVANKSVNSILDEALSKVGRAFNIPKSVMLGDFEKDDLDNILTYSLDGIAEMISQAFNRRWYGYRSYKNGTYCKLDTTNARHLDMVSIASISNNIISSGIYTINEVREKVGEPLVDTKIGDTHFITRNYAVIGDAYLDDPSNTITEDTGQAADNPAVHKDNNSEQEEETKRNDSSKS